MTDRRASKAQEASVGGPRHPEGHVDTVELWAACFADVAVLPEPWITRLDAFERRQLDRLRLPRRAIGYAGRHVMLRERLGAAVGEASERLQIGREPFGRPVLSRDGAPTFSLSSAGEVAVLALRRSGPVGVDIANLGPVEAELGRLFTPAEQARLEPLREPELSAALLRLWVAKEAVLKASGTGLSVAPDAVEVEPPWHEATSMRATLSSHDPMPYVIQPFRVTATVIGAVASDRPVASTLRWWRRCQCRADCSACTTSLIA